MLNYEDKDILKIIGFPCQCHPYNGPTCDKCEKIDFLYIHQSKDLRRLLNEGKIRIDQYNGLGVV